MLLIIILHLLGRHLRRRQERRRNDILRHLRQEIATHVRYSREAVPKQGLDPWVIASLPLFAYKIADKSNDYGGESIAECSVCLCNIVEDAMVRALPNCKHVFHVECIDMWLESHTTCPVCRTMAQPGVQPEKNQLHSGVQPSTALPDLEENNQHGGGQSEKVGESGTRFGSFRWMLNKEKSSRTQ